jgi:hypothetical protein
METYLPPCATLNRALATPRIRDCDHEAAALKARHAVPPYSPALTLAANRSSTPFTYL